jgi:hypothetical protein
MTDSPTKETVVMPPDVRRRLFELRCKSKRGELSASADIAFLEDCWRKWPAEYEAMNREVFMATAPFGSQV